MTDSSASPSPLPLRWLGPFGSRPRLTGSAALGIAAFLAMTAFGVPEQATLRAVLSWDLVCLAFVALMVVAFRHETIADLKARCARQDEGQGLILGVVLIAVAASLVAVGAELSAAKDDHGVFRSLRVGAAGCTVALSWFMVQMIFALHYAHEYYQPDETTPEEDDVVGGLNFPGGHEPDSWDFVHFAVVIGVACQTADVAFTKRRLRRLGTVHGLMAFVFNTVVLALAINLLAGLF